MSKSFGGHSVYSLSCGDRAKEHNNDSDVVFAAALCSLCSQPLGAHSRLFHRVLDDGEDILVADHIPQSIASHNLQNQIKLLMELTQARIILDYIFLDHHQGPSVV